MNRRNSGGGGAATPKLELKLNLSPPRANRGVESPSRSATKIPNVPNAKALFFLMFFTITPPSKLEKT
uniref:Uncharacterized protein n=1 Tax=Cucumis melo TaxID=3656 RepID=A0A9I9DVS1_CUCME